MIAIAFILLCAVCTIGVTVQIIREERDVRNNYDRIFNKSRILWIGQVPTQNLEEGVTRHQ